MFRDLVSYSVLILVPAVSLVIAVVPFIVVKKRLKSKQVSKLESGQVTLTEGEVGPYPRPSASNPRVSALSWGAFFVGLIGNVVWWWLISVTLNTSKTSIYLKGAETDGIMLGFFLYSFFVVITPFIFYKIKHGHFTGKAIVYNLIVSLLTAGVVLGVWIVLAVIAYRGLFEQLN